MLNINLSKINIYNTVCPITMGKITCMFLETFKNMCDYHCKKGKWINNKKLNPYIEKCKICDGKEFPPELNILNKTEEGGKMENIELVELKNKLNSSSSDQNDKTIEENSKPKTICEMCKQTVSVKRNSFGKKVCQTCYVGSRFVYNNPEIALQLLKDHPTNIYDLNKDTFENNDKKVETDGYNYKEENKKLKKIIDLICEKLNINIYDSVFEKISDKFKK